jgi:large repetitive protein
MEITTKVAPTRGAWQLTVSDQASQRRRWFAFNGRHTRTLGRLILALTLIWLLPAKAAPIQYIYDNLGRLVGVINATGSGTRYTYDAAGNILSTINTAGVSIIQFTPSSSAIGATVSIYGTGFSTTAALNTVKFNGTTATVTGTPTANRIDVIVPVGATSGTISITSPTGTAVSTGVFAVGGSQIPTISGFTPAQGGAGTALTINGTNFQSITTSNKVVIGSQYAVVSSASASSLQVIVPNRAVTGRIAVTTPFGKATSANDFYVDSTIPVVAGRIAMNGANLPVNINVAGKSGILSFDGVKDQYLGLGIGTLTCSPSATVALTLFAPDGTLLFSLGSVGTAGGSFNLPKLPLTGPYALSMKPTNNATCSFAVTLSSDLNIPITINGSSVSSGTTRAGQNARFTFSGTFGQFVGLGISNLTGASVRISVISPTGAVLINCVTIAVPGSSCTLPKLPVNGTYTVFADPSGIAAASFNVTLSTDVAGTLVTNGAAQIFTTTRVGQNARYSFTANAGENPSLLWSGGTFANNFALVFYRPDGTTYVPPVVSAIGPEGTRDLPNLPATGTYTVLIDPAGASTGTVSVKLVGESTSVLTINAAPQAIVLNAGQNGRYTFSGTAGQNLGLGISSYVSAPAGGQFTVKLVGPNGSIALPICLSYWSAPGGDCQLPTLPATGTYSILVDPIDTKSASFSVALSSDISGALIVNGAAATFSTTRVGQSGRYTFSGTAGQNLSVYWNGGTVPTGSNRIYVYNPNGTELTNAAFGDAASGRSSGTIDLINLSATGTYSIVVDSYGTNVGAVSILLRENATNALTLGGVASAIALTAGQNGTYTFTGSVGQQLGLGITALSTTPAGGSVNIRVMDPFGTLLFDCLSFTSAGGGCRLPALPATGTYRIGVDPDTTSSANLTLTLSSDLAGALAVGGVATAFTTARAGQNGRYALAGTAGQNLRLAWNGSTIPGAWSYFYIYQPDGTLLANTNFSDAPGGRGAGTLDMNNLPATGTYTVLVDPYGGNLGLVNLQATLLGTTPPAGQTPNGTIAIDGAATSVTLTSGQEGRYTFTGTVGQKLGLGLGTLAFTPSPNSLSVVVTLPDNTTVLVTCPTIFSPGGSCNLPPLPSTGTYTVRLNPGVGYAATLSVSLSADIASTLAVGAAVTTFNTTRIGQNGRYTFSGSAGQNLSLSWSGATIPGFYSYMYVYKPDGSELTNTYFGDAASGRVSGTLDLTSLPATGTYTIFVDPYSDSTGSVALQLVAENTNTLAVDGLSLSVTLAGGQNGRYSFTGAVGQRLGLGIRALTGTDVTATLKGPTGQTLSTCTFNLVNTGGDCNVPALPAAGTYTIAMDPLGTASSTFAATLSNDTTGTLVLGGASASYSALRAGQDGRYTFAGTVGQNATILWNPSTFVGNAYLSVLNPDGTILVSPAFYANSQATLDLSKLPATGTYTVFVDPSSNATGDTTLQLLPNATGVLLVDGAPSILSLTSGQNGRYTFSGTAGQNLGLGLSNVSTAPSGQLVPVTVYSPTGDIIATCPNISSAGGPCDLPGLPSTGTYVVTADIASAASATFTVTLSNDVTGTLVSNGATLTFNTTRIGQNGRYVFNGVGGQSVRLHIASSTFSGVPIKVLLPDGTIFNQTTLVSPSLDIALFNFPVTGPYAVLIDPASYALTGSLNLNLTNPFGP